MQKRYGQLSSEDLLGLAVHDVSRQFITSIESEGTAT